MSYRAPPLRSNFDRSDAVRASFYAASDNEDMRAARSGRSKIVTATEQPTYSSSAPVPRPTESVGDSLAASIATFERKLFSYLAAREAPRVFVEAPQIVVAVQVDRTNNDYEHIQNFRHWLRTVEDQLTELVCLAFSQNDGLVKSHLYSTNALIEGRLVSRARAICDNLSFSIDSLVAQRAISEHGALRLEEMVLEQKKRIRDVIVQVGDRRPTWWESMKQLFAKVAAVTIESIGKAKLPPLLAAN